MRLIKDSVFTDCTSPERGKINRIGQRLIVSNNYSAKPCKGGISRISGFQPVKSNIAIFIGRCPMLLITRLSALICTSPIKKPLATLLLFVPIFLSAQTIDTTIFASTCKNKIPYYLPYGISTYGPYNASGLYFVDTIFTTLDHSQWEAVYLHLTLYDLTPKYTHDFICANKTPYVFGNLLLYDTGTYQRTILSSSGTACDTIEILYLTINPVYYDTIFVQRCKGESYTGNGFDNIKPETAGTFYFTRHEFSSCYKCNCDSMITLKLQVLPSPQETILHREICKGETYSENGFNKSTSGEHRLFLHDVNGCDSIVTLYLIVNEPDADRFHNAEICEGNVYSANGFYIDTVPGRYTFIEDRFTKDGCPYTVTLYLTVLPNLRMEMPTVNEICGDDAYFPIEYNVITGKIEKIEVNFDDKAKEAGFVNFVEYYPETNIGTNNINIPLPDTVRPDNYSVTLYFEGRCYDTTFTVDFTVLYPSSVMEQRWNDVIILKNPAYNGGYDFSYIEWFVNDNTPIAQKYIYNKDAYIYTEGSTLLQSLGDRYRVCLIRKGEYHQICSCPLELKQHQDRRDYPCIDDSRIVSGMGRLKVYSCEPIVEMYLWNIYGQIIQQKHYADAGDTIEISADAGIYILRIVNNKGQIYTTKVIVQ